MAIKRDESYEEKLKERMDDVRRWVSYRGQTLSRTGKHKCCLKVLPSQHISLIFFVLIFFGTCISERNDVLQGCDSAAMFFGHARGSGLVIT